MVFGKCHAHQAAFSILSIFEVYKKRLPNFEIHILTDCAQSFKFIDASLPIKTECIEERVLESWKGKEKNMMRAKIEAILHVLRSTGGNVLYLDSDTVLMHRIDWIFDYLEKGGFVMHKPEWRLAAGRKKHPELCPVDFDFSLSNGLKLAINADSPMCNAGVIGLGSKSEKLLETVIDLYEKMYSQGPSWHVEQFAFSILLSRTKRLRFCRREIFHYWHNKELAKSFIEQFDCLRGLEGLGEYRRMKWRFVWLARAYYYIHQIRVLARKNKLLHKIFISIRKNIMKRIKRYQRFVIEILKNWKISKPILNNFESMLDGVKFGGAFANSGPKPLDKNYFTKSANPLEDYFDRNLVGHGIWKWRQYFEMYHTHLEKFIGKKPKIVEVGVYSGGSLPMWIQYFGQGAHIHGIDIEPACKTYENESISIHIGDQENRKFWDAFFAKVPEIDVFIDDGGHTPNQQRITLEEVLPRLKPGGIYICEDIHSENNTFFWFLSGILSNLNANNPFFLENGEPASHSSNFQKWVKSVSFYPYAVVIEKNNIALPILKSPRRGTIWQPFLDRHLK